MMHIDGTMINEANAARLNTLKLIEAGPADDIGCLASECHEECKAWTYLGFNGYAEACKKHAREYLADAIEFTVETWVVFDEKLREQGSY